MIIKLILMNIFFIIVVPSYLVYTKYGSIVYGDTYMDISSVFICLSVLVTAAILIAEHK